MQRLAKHPDRWLMILCAVMIGLGVVVRSSHLERPFFWLDETFTALRVSGQTLTSLQTAFQDGQPQPIAALEPFQTVQLDRPVWDSARSLQRDGEAQQPLYYLLLNLWMRLWAQVGYGTGDRAIGAMRSFSVFCSLLTLPALYRLATRFWESARAGWLAIALMSVSPIFIIYAQEARPYALWVLTIVIMSDALLLALQHDRWRFWGLYSLSLTASFYVFVNTLFIVLAQGVALLAYGIGQQRSRPQFPEHPEDHAPSRALNYLPENSLLEPNPPRDLRRIAHRWVLTTLASAISLGFWFVPLLPIWSKVGAQVSWLEMPIAPIALLAAWIGNGSRLWLDVGLNGTQFLETWTLLPNLVCVALTVLPLVWGGRKVWHSLRSGDRDSDWDGEPEHSRSALYFALLCADLIPLGAVILPDLLFGGQRSTVIRYILPSFIAIQLLWVGWFVAKPQFDWRRWGVLALMLGLGVLSGVTYSSATIWWNKQPSLSYGTLTAATLINAAPEPIVLSDQFQIMPLTYHLEDSVKVLLAAPGQPLAVDVNASLFVFVPSPEFLEEFQQLAIASQNRPQPFELVEQVPATLWQLIPSPESKTTDRTEDPTHSDR